MTYCFHIFDIVSASYDFKYFGVYGKPKAGICKYCAINEHACAVTASPNCTTRFKADIGKL